MALTKVTGHVVKPDTNIQFHNTKSTGIVTFAHTDNATSSTTGALQVTGGVGIVKDLHVGGNVTVGGTLTYDDVTNIDSLGIITARGGIHVGPITAGVATVYTNGNASFTGIVTATSFVGGLPITNGADNRVITAASASSIQGESLLTFNGYGLGINDTSGNARLIVSGNSDNGDHDCSIRIYDTDTTAGSQMPNISFWGGSTEIGGIRSTDTSGMRFFTHDGSSLDERLRIASDGKIGINTSPLHSFEIFTGADHENIIQVKGTNPSGVYAGMGVYQGNAVFTGGGIGSNSAGIVVRTAASGSEVERLRIGSNGSVGIGTDYLSTNATTYHKLMVEGDTTSSIAVAKILRRNSSASNETYTFEVDSSAHTSNMTSGGAMSVDVYSGRAFTIDGNGQIGIGTILPKSGSPLHIHGTGASDKPHIRITADRGLVARLGDTSGGAQAMFDLYDPSDGSTQIVRLISGGGKNFINTGGVLGIGTDNPQAEFEVFGYGAAASGATPILAIRNGYSGTADASNALKSELRFLHKNHNAAHEFMAARIEASTTNNYSQLTNLSFYTANGNNGTERLRITSMGDIYAGNADVGGYPIFDNSTIRPRFQFRQGTGTNRGFALIETRGDANSMALYLAKSREGPGTGVINSGDQLGSIQFTGADGTNQVTGAQILAYTSGTIAADRIPTNLAFYTHPDSTAGKKERLRITSGGKVSIGDDATHAYSAHSEGDDLVIGGAGWRGMTIYGEGGGGVIQFADDASNRVGQILYNHGNDSMMFRTAGNVDRLKIHNSGRIQIGAEVGNTADIDTTNTRLTVKQTANNREDGIYIERSGERRGWLMFVGGSYGFNDAFCLSTNQNGTKTDVLSIDRGNRLAKIGGDVIIDSSNNGYGGLRIYDDSSGDYNVRYITGRNQGLTAHVFERGGRTQNQSPWTNTTSSEIARLTYTNGISFRGDGTTNIGSHASHHLRVKTNDKDAIHIDNRRVATIAKLNTKAQCFSSCTTKWANSRSVMKFYMDFYTGNSSATYHFMRLISQPDWSFDDIVIRQNRYQYHPSSADHATRRYYTWYGSHTEQIINYNQKDGGSGTSAESWIVKRDNFGPSGAFKIHESANGGYYRDAWGSDYAISLGNYIGVRLEITIYNTTGVYDTSRFATASDFYPAAYGGEATQSAADSWGGPRGVWFNTTSNGTGSGTAPVLRMHDNAAEGWSTGTSFFDTSI